MVTCCVLIGLMMGVSVLHADAAWETVTPGRRFTFPRDHGRHPGFQSEWWYFTGHLWTPQKRRFGYELTFFRLGVSSEEAPGLHFSSAKRRPSRWHSNEFYLGHFALSDIQRQRFQVHQQLTRPVLAMAGSREDRLEVWNRHWRVSTGPGETLTLTASVPGRYALALTLQPKKPVVLQGDRGYSQKTGCEGCASYYLSYTRLAASGTLTLEDGTAQPVSGLSWMDHEIMTNYRYAALAGWDWFAIQLRQGTDLMLYRLRRRDGSLEPWSAAAWIDAQGRVETVRLGKQVTLQPGRLWTSPKTGASYPVTWQIRWPARDLALQLTTLIDDQEIDTITPNTPDYWEGACTVSGTLAGKPVTGDAYLEMTGYSRKQ